MEGKFHDKLKIKIHTFVSFCYKISKKIPQKEIYGLISQLTRASMSVMLNYVEGYARRRDKVKLNFYEISYGSIQECKYIIYFIKTQNWINENEYKKGIEMSDEISKMIWSTINYTEEKIKE